MMKAVVITAPGVPEVLKLVERPKPEPGTGQVLIRVRAAGVNRPDVYQRKGNYPPPAWAPQDIPGLEVSGIIEICGDTVTQWKKGDSVCALVVGGGYADYVIAEAGHCLPVPAGLNFAEAASLPETVFTVWHNVFQRGKLAAGENLLVHGGTSGIGITAIQLGAAMGAKVYATAGTQEKCKACEELGAVKCINYKTEDFAQQLAPVGMDVILDMVGGDYISKNLHLLRPEGRLVFVNTMQGNNAEIDFGMVMRKRLTITGSTLRNRDNDFKSNLAGEILNQVWPLITNGRFRPVIYREFPLEQAAGAHRFIEEGSHIGKIILVNVS
ncbi:NAD(P)H-quinone oxidoreductase [Dyadobacter helix]|nr:NAD(P)H-quinone oxidoreductase [Dyadobacter sp. CECT 9275]